MTYEGRSIQMADSSWLADRFQENRSHLRSVAYRMLGSVSEAEDAVQEAWIRLSRSDANNIENLAGWLTTVVARVCLDQLRRRSSKYEESIEDLPEISATSKGPSNPEQEVLMADSVGLALLVVLDRLSPAERIAFVLHDLFGFSFEEIGRTLERSPTSARQLASRARRRVRGVDHKPTVSEGQRELLDKFLAALSRGNVEELLTVLDPDLTVRVGKGAGRPGSPRELHGAETWARGAVAFSRVAATSRPALVDGRPGLVFAPGGRLSRALRFTFGDGKITEIEIFADPTELSKLDLGILEG
jgi:RNA polymerase sigma-70 factor (ECF subfamily)